MSQKALSQVLRRIPTRPDPNLLVGAATADDAGVYRLDRERALVLTVDFLTPIVDDPFTYGRIAATNALSDVYAMGGRPLTALNVLGFPDDRVPPSAIQAILRGGTRQAHAAGCTIVGGHTIRNPEPIYGLAVTGIVDPRRMLTNAAGRPGDRLVLTKPLGTGIVATAVKRGLAPRSLAALAIASMGHLNSVGAILAEQGLVRAATDVTGFGLLGHLASLCRASRVGARLVASQVPALSPAIRRLIEADCIPSGSRENLRTASLVRWHGVAEPVRLLLADAQTSGGLLLCVPPKRLPRVLALLRRHATPASAVIGEITATRRPRIDVIP